MGCGCNKGRVANASTVAAKRVTVYQVLVNSSVESEHENLADARAQATKVGGRVKVTSKNV